MIWDTQLSQEIDLLRESTHRFAAAEIAPIADEIDQKNEFPQELWQKWGKWGYSALPFRRHLEGRA